jgi:predicted metal-dependent phosphoesterase TrpH
VSILNADLHCHSVVSDGTLTPEALAQRAHANGVQLWALTDHDEIGGQQRAATAAKALGMHYLSGTEISVSFAGHTVHIVGLGFDIHDPRVMEGLQSTRGGRHARAQDMAAGLAKVGIHGSFEGALTYAGNPDLISRTHFARYLVETGVCKDTYEVFRRFLTEGKPGFVPHRWANLKDAIAWIRDAGGMAVIAHPARYDFTPNEEFALFTEFKAQVALNERAVLAMAQIEGVGAVDAADLVNVAKAAGGDQRGARAAALKHGVDGHGGAMQEQMRLGQRHASFVQAVQDAMHQFIRGGEGLAQEQAALALVKGGDVGEGAANVGGEPGPITRARSTTVIEYASTASIGQRSRGRI